ncbi:MAG: tetratricopeptide repeat protein [Rhodothermales bacterium]
MKSEASVRIDTSPSRSSLSTGKRRLFTLAMGVVPVLFFVLLEGLLRLVGYGDAYPLFVPISGYPEYLRPSRDVGRRYFARQQNVPTIPFDSFTARKDSNTYRIFVQGGSSAAGYPFYYGASFADLLEQRLLQTFPGRNIEVVNTAMAAVNSYTLLDFADDIIAQEPDAVLIYAGHNEYYGALGVGSSESLGQMRPLVKTYLGMQHLRVVQGLRALLAQAAGLFGGRKQGEIPGTTLMERMVGEQAIPYGSPAHSLGLRQFRGNLSDLLARYKKHGIPVFVSTLVSNERDQEPFVSNLSPATDADAWQAAYRRGLQAATEGDTAAALTALDTAIRMDSLSADAFYARGRVLDAAGRFDEARRAYRAAKDRDQLPFRAPEAVNWIIREETARHGALLVETQEALAYASPEGLIGSNLILEHLHPNVEGYLHIADAFYEALRREHVIGEWTSPVPLESARREILLTQVDSLVGMLRVRQLMSSWPFQLPGVVDRSLLPGTPNGPLEELAFDLYQNKVGWLDMMSRLQQYYQTRGDYHHALQASLAVIQRYPFLPNPYLAAGDILLRQHRYDEALAYFEAANDREESAAAQRMIGSILLQRGQQDGAIEHLERALALEPNHPQTLYNLSGAYALTRQFEKARTTVTHLLDVAPNHQDGRRLLSSLPPARQ